MNCYNGEKYLREAINSVLAQTYENWELVFWDNQSADQSAEIFKSYHDPRLKYFFAPKHTLLYEARNYAIAKAKGEFLAFLDVDDWWNPEKLARQVPLFDDPSVGFLCSNYWVVEEPRKIPRLAHKRPIPQGRVLNDLLMDYAVCLVTLVIRREAFDRLVGGCDSRFHIIGDLDLVTRLASTWEMACCQEPLAYYRRHGESEGETQKARQAMEYQIWVDEIGRDPNVSSLPGYAKVTKELMYTQGRLCAYERKEREAMRYLAKLPWGKYKLKLALLMLKLYLPC